MNNNNWITTITNLLNIFGEETFFELPLYTRTSLNISETYHTAEAVYSARIFPRTWKRKEQTRLLNILNNSIKNEFKGGIIVKDFSDDSCFFNSRISIKIQKSYSHDDFYEFSITILDFERTYLNNPFGLSIYKETINHRAADVNDTIRKIEKDRMLLKNINTSGRIANRICHGLEKMTGNWRLDTPKEILYLFPSFCTRIEKAFLPGDTIRMGVIPETHKNEDARGNAIRWQVAEIDTEHNRVLVVSKKILSHKKIYEAAEFGNYKSYTYKWSDCNVNKWLNTAFIPLYSLKEVPIISVEHETEAGNNASVQPKETTSEKVFILSNEETEKYNHLVDSRWASELGSTYRNGNVTRTPSPKSKSCISGWDRNEDTALYESIGIRPAFWLDLDYAKSCIRS